MSKDLNIRYKNPELQRKWQEAVAWLRSESRQGWVLDKVVERQSK